MRTVPAHHEELHERVEALRAAIGVALRPVPCVLLALLLGVLNPALCVLHCALLHHGVPAASASAPGHTHHVHTSDTHTSGPGMELCAVGGHPEHAQPTPLAAYELTLVVLLLGALARIRAIHTPRAPWRPHASHPSQPPAPPPQPLAFI